MDSERAVMCSKFGQTISLQYFYCCTSLLPSPPLPANLNHHHLPPSLLPLLHPCAISSPLLSALQSEYKDFHVPVGTNTFIHTVLFEPTTPPEEPATPLVMIHGFGCGIPQFYKNYDHLHATRHVYSLDLPGYGRSTRVQFTDNPQTNEDLFVEYLEKWREKVGLEKFILLGHSFGGFLSAAYAIKYPSRVRHLVLNDPWGMPVFREEMDSGRRRFPMWINIAVAVITKFNPFTPVRMAGPAGKRLN